MAARGADGLAPVQSASHNLAVKNEALIGKFTQVVGDFPFKEPNVRAGHEQEDLSSIINVGSSSNWCCALACCATGIGCCYVCQKCFLVEQGQYGFTLNNGVPEIYFPGRNVAMSPLNVVGGVYSMGQDFIHPDGPVTIVRINIGQCGIALNNGIVELLLPGVHARNSAAFEYQRSVSLDSELIEQGPIKIFIVRSGVERVCFNNGQVIVYREGRYAINSSTFAMGPIISTQQQNLRFTRHLVLLDGGISMYVEGLLTYQVSDVRKLMYQLQTPLEKAIESVTKAELSRVFAALHLEQISSAVIKEEGATEKKQDSYLGAPDDEEPGEGNARAGVCLKVMENTRPIVDKWGVIIVNFQLESTMLADKTYALEYEAASLQMAKAKSELRALDAKNQILIQNSTAQAESVRIKAEGDKAANVLMAEAAAQSVQIAAAARVQAARSESEAVVITANAQAVCREIEAKSRQEAAEKMTEEFGRRLQLGGQEVAFGSALKATVLTVTPDSMVGRVLGGNFTGGRV